MSNVVNKIFVDKMGGKTASDFIGQPGEIFYDPNTGSLRISDGVTVGGKSIVESSPLESLYIGDWVYFVRPDDEPDVMDHIAPNLILARAEGGSLYNAYDQEDGYELNNPSGTEWNTDGWTDFSDVTNRYYDTLSNARAGGGWAATKHEFVMHDTNNDKYYAIRFLAWDGGDNNATGAFSYIRREINTDIYFNRVDTDDEEVALTGGDQIAEHLVITRGDGGPIFNIAEEDNYDDDESPKYTLWSQEGWDDLTNLTDRHWMVFHDLTNGEQLGKRIVGREYVMHDTIADKYYAIKFTRWQQGQYEGGLDYPGFSYIRRQIDTTKLSAGLKFNDGTVQNTAYSYKNAAILKKANTLNVANRYLTPDDIGKMIYFDGNGVDTLIVSDGGAAEFPVGATVTIINRSGNTVYVNKDNDDENGTIYGAGTSDSGTSWEIPDNGGGNIAVLIKISTSMDNYTNDWMLSGAGIVEN
jgi:hypothetical protein